MKKRARSSAGFQPAAVGQASSLPRAGRDACATTAGEDARATSGAFTLVELIVVMGLLAMLLAFVAPSLGRSMRQRNLEGEAARFLAATEYARDEAVSQGVPMIVWIDEKKSRFGVEVKDGFIGAESRDREFALHADIQMELEKSIGRNAKVQPIEFAPDGTPATTNVEMVTLKDRFDAVLVVARTEDGWGYEILEEAAK
jgi:type II secretion system protein H